MKSNDSLQKARILVVDDAPLSSEVLVNLLKNDYEVRVADSSAAALACLDGLAKVGSMPDLIIMDIVMPEMDGFELCRTLREKYVGGSDIPVIFYTNLLDTDSHVKAFAQGGTEYISKSQDPAILLVRLRAHLQLAIQKRELDNVNRELAQRFVELDRLNAEIKFKSNHDALTSLPNRVLLNDRLERAVSMLKRRPTEKLALMLIDLDRFKPINDTYGHEAGDCVLIEVAQRLLACVRKTDTVCRLGGDEFVVLLNDIPDEEAVRQISGNMLFRLRQPIIYGEQVLHISASIGCVVVPSMEVDPKVLLSASDQMMYLAKECGGDTLRVKLLEYDC